MSAYLFRVARVLAAGLCVLAWPALPALANDAPQKLLQRPAIAAADWANVSEVVVELNDNNYEPDDLSFKVGKPYKLVLRNIGNAVHDMVGGSFFNPETIALWMVNTRVGRVTADNINSVYIRPKQEAELWFVPVKAGSFSFFCSISGHREAGMEGGVKIID